MPGLWNKFLMRRRDGSVPDWPWLVLGARDPSTPTAIRAMADWHAEHGTDGEYVDDLRRLANEWDRYRAIHGDGDPEAGPHREDNPDIIAVINSVNATVNFRKNAN